MYDVISKLSRVFCIFQPILLISFYGCLFSSTLSIFGPKILFVLYNLDLARKVEGTTSTINYGKHPGVV